MGDNFGSNLDDVIYERSLNNASGFTNVVTTYLRFQVEDVIGDCQVVFKSEGRQNHAVANRKRKSHFTWEK